MDLQMIEDSLTVDEDGLTVHQRNQLNQRNPGSGSERHL
jgi:hypothetical protein